MTHQPALPSETILIAEDNAFVRMQIAKFLRDGGYQVVEVDNGEAALSMLEEHDFGLAMVDVRMEPVDGFEFVRTIRGLDVTMPVVLVTGDSTPDLLEQANKWGVSAVLIKPVQKERLMKTVEKTIQGYRKGA
jgi:CheY-like chemotaxis protein